MGTAMARMELVASIAHTRPTRDLATALVNSLPMAHVAVASKLNILVTSNKGSGFSLSLSGDGLGLSLRRIGAGEAAGTGRTEQLAGLQSALVTSLDVLAEGLGLRAACSAVGGFGDVGLGESTAVEGR